MSDNSMILIHSSGRSVDLDANSKDNPLRPLTPGGNVDLKIKPNSGEGFDFHSTALALPGQGQANSRNFTHPSESSPRASLPEPDGPVRYRIDVLWSRHKGSPSQETGTQPFGLWVGPYSEEHAQAVSGDTLTAIQAQLTEQAADLDKIKAAVGVED